MYAVVENHSALLIDPHKNKRALRFLQKNAVENITILLTHEHSDHTSGITFFKKHFKNALLIASRETSDYLADPKNAHPILINFILQEQDKANGTALNEKFNAEFEAFCGRADVVFEDGFDYAWNNHTLKFLKIAGHSPGSVFIFLDDDVLFTGDSLMKDYPVLTRLPRGNKKAFVEKTLPFFATLPQHLNIFPGHGTPFLLKDLYQKGALHVAFQ